VPDLQGHPGRPKARAKKAPLLSSELKKDNLAAWNRFQICGAAADVLATQGVDKQKFRDVYDSDTVGDQMYNADRLLAKCGVKQAAPRNYRTQCFVHKVRSEIVHPGVVPTNLTRGGRDDKKAKEVVLEQSQTA
jgi:hypothetical protein